MLEDNLINLIAAGEVVERPASVIKELVENSLDAKATTIKVNVKSGGRELIEIADNGVGIASEDIELAFSQHATSKIASAKDLEEILSFGFRGEALASIAQVSNVHIATTNNKVTTTAEVNYGKLVNKKSETTGLPSGTTIRIADLFSNVPARLKFLKTDNTEWRKSLETIYGLAIPNWGIRFEIERDSKSYLKLPSAPDLKTRIYDIFGEQTTKELLPVSYSGELKIEGLVSKPLHARTDTKIQHIFLNGRAITDKTIMSAVKEGFSGFLHKDLKPAYFLLIDINPHQVDVNVHPRKQEVRFSDNGFIFREVYRAIHHLLESEAKSEVTRYSSQFTPPSNEISLVENFATPLYSNKESHNIPQPRPAFKSVQSAIGFSQAVLQTTSDSEPARSKPWQLFSTYIVFEQDGEVRIVDQHAAAERILFEKLELSLKNEPPRDLLVPETLELAASAKEQLLESEARLKEIGFGISDAGGNNIFVHTLPAALPKQARLNSLLTELAEKLEHTHKDIDTFHDVLASLACHGSIRAGQPLETAEMEQILSDLGKCRQPGNCPHGRPTSWALSRREIEQNFKRVI